MRNKCNNWNMQSNWQCRKMSIEGWEMKSWRIKIESWKEWSASIREKWDSWINKLRSMNQSANSCRKNSRRRKITIRKPRVHGKAKSNNSGKIISPKMTKSVFMNLFRNSETSVGVARGAERQQVHGRNAKYPANLEHQTWRKKQRNHQSAQKYRFTTIGKQKT